jgi:predicted lipid-binding transport protein (Tim44 family)
MGDGFQYLDIILLAMIAAFIALRLRSILGRRTGHEGTEPEQSGFPAPVPADGRAAPVEGKPVDQAAGRASVLLDETSPAYDGLRKIAARDSAFNPDIFISGAQSAYDMILEAFWRGNKAGLKSLVGDEVRSHFEQAITEREKAGLTVGNKLAAIRKADIEAASLTGSTARITVKYVSDIIMVTRDSENRVVEGDVTDTVEAIDIWTYERDLKKSDPNWILIRTRSGH